MKAVSEIGLKKSFKFFGYSLLQPIFNILPFSHLRKTFLQLLGAQIGRDSILMGIKFFNWHHKGPVGLKVGVECFIGDETLIDLYDSVVLEDQVTIAQRVNVLTHLNVGYKNHPLQKYFPKISEPVMFKNGSVVGAGSVILPGTTVGEGSFVAAGSVVTKNVPAWTLVGGVPAKTIRKIK